MGDSSFGVFQESLLTSSAREGEESGFYSRRKKKESRFIASTTKKREKRKRKKGIKEWNCLLCWGREQGIGERLSMAIENRSLNHAG